LLGDALDLFVDWEKMMRKIFVAMLVIWSSLVSAGVLNVEFNFTPFVGDMAKSDHVVMVPGKAAIYVNNVPYAEQEIQEGETPVLFESREIGAAVWIRGDSMGPALRKGKNTIRVEFVPANLKKQYAVQLRWASVMDHVTNGGDGRGRSTSTNQSDEGVDNRAKVVGKITLEREFAADFAIDQPWHHYPAITTLTDADKQMIAALLNERAGTFKPDFSSAHQLLKSSNTPGLQLDVAEIQKSKILQKAYAAGLRIAAPPIDQLDFITTGNPEVVVRGKAGALFPIDDKALGRIKGDELQMALAMVLSVLYPPQFVVVRDKAGKWTVVY
jgi:hypothetical protein